MKKEICKTDEVQYEEVTEAQLTEKEKAITLETRWRNCSHIFSSRTACRSLFTL